MKILASSDIHGDKELVKELAERAEEEEADLVVVCGDLTEFGGNLEGLIGPFKAKNKRILLIPGNHESFSTLKELAEIYKPGVKVLQNRPFRVGGVSFFSPKSISSFLQDPLNSLEEKGKEKRVMVTHPPPLGTELDFLRGRHVGSPLVRRIIEDFQPDLCLCGHIHENFGKIDKIGRTKVVNVGRKGKVIEV